MEALLGFFTEHGWEGILAIAVMGGLILGAKYISNKIGTEVKVGLDDVGNKLIDQQTKQNEVLIDKIIQNQDKMLEWIINRDNHSDNNHASAVDDRIKFSEDINQALKDILNVHNAHRVCIFEFHNSQANLSGTPFAKYSCTYEYVAKGIAPISNKCQGLPISQLAHIINEVQSAPDQILVYDDMTKLEDENPILASLLKETGANTIAYAALFDRDNTLIGLLGIEYWVPVEEANLQENQLKLQAAELTSIINLRYKYRDKENK